MGYVVANINEQERPLLGRTKSQLPMHSKWALQLVSPLACDCNFDRCTSACYCTVTKTCEWGVVYRQISQAGHWRHSRLQSGLGAQWHWTRLCQSRAESVHYTETSAVKNGLRQSNLRIPNGAAPRSSHYIWHSCLVRHVKITEFLSIFIVSQLLDDSCTEYALTCTCLHICIIKLENSFKSTLNGRSQVQIWLIGEEEFESIPELATDFTFFSR